MPSATALLRCKSDYENLIISTFTTRYRNITRNVCCAVASPLRMNFSAFRRAISRSHSTFSHNHKTTTDRPQSTQSHLSWVVPGLGLGYRRNPLQDGASCVREIKFPYSSLARLDRGGKRKKLFQFGRPKITFSRSPYSSF